MKPRRASGAAHSFRLSRVAADMVDRLPPFVSIEGNPYNRSLGGKSKLVSDAIVWCYASSDRGHGTYGELVNRLEWWVKHCDEITAAQISEPLAPPRRSIWDRIASWIRRN